MMKILVTDGMDKSAVKELETLGYVIEQGFYQENDLKDIIKDFDILVVRSKTKVTKEIIDSAIKTRRLKMIIRAGVGIDNIDAQYAKNNDINVRNTPNASSIAVAELTIAHMLSLARFLYRSNTSMRNGEWNKSSYKGLELYGKTLGLIGFGKIARETAKRASALGMEVIYNNRSGAKEEFSQYAYVTKEELFKRSDFISIHIPYDKSIGTIIGENEIKMIKDGAHIINCARGKLIDEEALLDALDSGKLAGAALDVFEEEPLKNKRLYTHGKVSLSPHIGASTKEAQERIGEEIVSLIRTNLPISNLPI